ncbi:MAG: hypothetical protein FD165_222 [Gammaproteobacteria bacterium]|nr:MAG: hypothetical protein FD165_222 [Gammaproteobacteria bacterium]TND06800.1 MAG: hypothetical protein FD120_532 [Gammaproteobacteria bacterium]
MKKLLLPLFMLSLLVPEVFAQTPEERGLEIVTEADRRDTGFGDSQAGMVMILRNRAGDESTRELRVSTLEMSGDGDRSLTIFDHPADVSGTAFLSYTHALDADDQWLYLPALKRVKRITSKNKSGPFMGSEFAFEDLTSPEIQKYRYKYLRNEKLDGRNTYVIERYPAYENSGYTRLVTWLDQERYQPLKVEFYDRKDALLKTLMLDNYKQYLDRYWRANRMTMVNHQTDKSTELTWSDYRFKTGLTERDFDQSSLMRAR